MRRKAFRIGFIGGGLENDRARFKIIARLMPDWFLCADLLELRESGCAAGKCFRAGDVAEWNVFVLGFSIWEMRGGIFFGAGERFCAGVARVRCGKIPRWEGNVEAGSVSARGALEKIKSGGAAARAGRGLLRLRAGQEGGPSSRCSSG
jgi:hypothetical protein